MEMREKINANEQRQLTARPQHSGDTNVKIIWKRPFKSRYKILEQIPLNTLESKEYRISQQRNRRYKESNNFRTEKHNQNKNLLCELSGRMKTTEESPRT